MVLVIKILIIMSKIRTQINFPENWFSEYKKHFNPKSLDVPLNFRERPKIRGERLLRGETLFTVLMNLILFIFITLSKSTILCVLQFLLFL